MVSDHQSSSLHLSSQTALNKKLVRQMVFFYILNLVYLNWIWEVLKNFDQFRDLSEILKLKIRKIDKLLTLHNLKKRGLKIT